MSKLDYLMITLLIMVLTYFGTSYLFNLRKILKQYIQKFEEFKNIEGISSRMERNMQNGLRLNEEVSKNITEFNRLKDLVRDRELNLINMEELCEANTKELNAKKQKYEDDLANCRAKNIKLEKRARESEARLADVLTKVSK